ncbi:ABC transporter substrate-binding protein, partial [Escherichia coli]
MIKSKIVLLSALVSCALISGCKEENKTNVSIEFMHSSVEQERQAVISKLIARFEKENPGITVKQVPVEEDAYNTKEGANKRGNSSRLTQSFHFFMFEPIFSPVNALNQP